MYLIGYDIGSSSIKVALVEAASGKTVATAKYPDTEMEIIAHQAGWAEQNPSAWWEAVCEGTKRVLAQSGIDAKAIRSVGIAYQMHGLVLVDQNMEVLRPSIIWCDSRAVAIGKEAFSAIGEEVCLSHFGNSPGNFTASKLKWVKNNEPEIYARIHKIMLPGDYIAMKLSGEIKTTVSGLSEGILWDFKNNSPAELLLDHYGIDKNLIPDRIETFDFQGNVHQSAAKATGLSAGTPIGYRAGDQPNNALSLSVFQPNEVAATGGTSGVVYGVVDQLNYDPQSRVNAFAHVNHSATHPRLGILLCINGAGIQYSWIKNQMALAETDFPDMERMASEIAVGSDGLRIIPFGNGAERVLGNQNTGAQVNNLQFNRHTRAHFYRACLEGVAFAFVYGMKVMRDVGLNPAVIKVGNDNLFQSAIFSNTISSLLGCKIQMIETNGAVGAAKGGGLGAGLYRSLEEAMKTNEIMKIYEPSADVRVYHEAYALWEEDLERLIR